MLFLTLLLVFLLPCGVLAESVNLAHTKPYVININSESSYADYKASELTDGKRGLNSIFNAAWQGHSKKEYRIVVVDLGATYQIDRVDIGFLQDESSNVWIPGSLTLAVSNDAQAWQVVTETNYSTETLTRENQIAIRSIDGNKAAGRYVAIYFKVSFWVFLDEVEIFGHPVALANKTSKSTLEDIDFNALYHELINHFNVAYYEVAEGDLMRVSEETGGAHDILLVYDQASGVIWNEMYAYPYVAYLDENLKAQDWFFDTFLFLALSAPSGRNFEAYSIADKYDWYWWLERVFSTGGGFDAFNRAVKRAGEELGDTEYKAKVIVMIPYPAEVPNRPFDDKKPGFLNPQIVGTEEAVKNRLQVVKDYIEEVLSRFDEKDYDRLELIGFYWLAENLDRDSLDRLYLPGIGDFLRKQDLRFYWIPWYLAPGYSEWRELGFDAVMMQPNYMFAEVPNKSRFIFSAAEAKKYQIGLEFEADPKILRSAEERELYYDYFRAANTLGYGNDILRGYYQDVVLYYQAAHSKDPEIRRIYDSTYDFIKGLYTEKFE
ncbi:MAG: DUF4855 domain-containing protein [Bacillota bacterium]